MNECLNSSIALINMISTIDTVSGCADMFLAFISDAFSRSNVEIGLTLAAMLGVISEGARSNMRNWHGNLDQKVGCIDNVVTLLAANQPTWAMPTELYGQLTAQHSQLQALVSKCRTNAASTSDRMHRDTLLKATVDLCLLQVKVWAHGQFVAGVLTADDVHDLGFLLPNEHGGRHARTQATDILAEVKVKVINEDIIRVVIDQSAGENAAQVVNGWPSGVHNALIVVETADGMTEVYRQMTTRLHNDIVMPPGSRGKQFIVKASFLKHVDDVPRFGNEPTFSMPLNTEDLASHLQH
jgi:hypothetical protein